MSVKPLLSEINPAKALTISARTLKWRADAAEQPQMGEIHQKMRVRVLWGNRIILCPTVQFNDIADAISNPIGDAHQPVTLLHARRRLLPPGFEAVQILAIHRLKTTPLNRTRAIP